MNDNLSSQAASDSARSQALLESLEGRTLLAGAGALYGQYYDNADFTQLNFTRDDSAIGFNWETRAPLTRMGADTFSVRWIGQLRSAEAGTYTFKVDTDGAATLRVRGQTIALASQNDGSRTGTINLPANQVVDLQLDYSHLVGAARISLGWMTPGQTTVSSIPTDRLLNTFAPAPATLSNPIIGSGADPWVIQWKDEYIYVWSDGGRIWGSRSPRLQDIGNAPAIPLYTPPAGTMYSQQVWAPELHRLDDKWYLYFAASDGNNATHRMYAATRTLDDPLGAFSFVGKLTTPTERWAIDGTVLELNGNRYFIWSGWQGFVDGQQDLYIARMSSPTTLTGERVRIATPDYAWERNGLPINEGPTILQKDGATHIIYSGSGYWTKQYALGRLTLTGNDPMLASSWTKSPTPVFSQGNGVTGVGHASFVKSPDAKEDWIVYHAHRFANSFNEDRVVRTQPFTFNGTVPDFGSPVPNGTSIAQPSGTPTLYTTSGSVTFRLLTDSTVRKVRLSRMVLSEL